MNQANICGIYQWYVDDLIVWRCAQGLHANMAFIEFKEVLERIPNKQRLELLLKDGTPTDIAQALRIMMINEVHVNPLDLIHGLNNHHWRVEVLALHRIVAPYDDLIDDIMGMSWD